MEAVIPFINNSDVLTKSVALVLAIAIVFVIDRLIKIKAASSEKFIKKLYEALARPAQVLLAISFFYTALKQFGSQFDLSEESFFWIQKIYIIAFILAVSWMAVRLTRFISNRILKYYDTDVSDNLHARGVHTQVAIIRRVLIAVIILVAVSAALMTFEQIRSLGVSLLASAGVAGIVLGLAAQKTLGNLITGIQIAITQPIRIGDSVVLEGEWGWIEEINLTYVVVKIWDLRRLVLPISYFVDKPFQNWTKTSAEVIGSVYLHVDYKMPVDPIREELKLILKDEPLWNGNVNVVQVTESTEKTMQLRVLVSGANAPNTWDLRCLVRERLITFIQEKYPENLPCFRAGLELDDIKKHAE